MNTDPNTLPSLDEILDANPKLKETLEKAQKKHKEPKPYVSPYKQEKYVPQVVTCVECSLSSHPGLPPLIKVNRLIDGEVKGVLRHSTCPSNADELAVDIADIAEARKAGRKWQKRT